MTTTTAVPRVSGGEDEHGHLEEFRTDPIGLMRRIRDECGDVGLFQLADKEVVLLTGAEANEFFFRAADEDLDQAEAYPFMTPIFGKGVIFDATPERRKEMLHNSALRGEQMKGHAARIEKEVHRMVADWGESGEIDLLDFFSELTIYTSSACLIGNKFRDELDHRFSDYYHGLECGTDPLCYVDPYLPIESFQVRDVSRVKLVGLVEEIMARRAANPPATKADRDMLDVLIAIKDEQGNPRFSADEITGMFISLMFAGHHTSSGTSSWTMIELIRHPDIYAGVVAELEDLYADGKEVSFHALRQIPKLDNVLKESLRLHPPLIIIMRVAKGEFEVQGYPIHKGQMVACSLAVSNRLPEDFPNPDAFNPDRYNKPQQEDLVNRWTYIPFGAGRHRCVGAAFATMQIKAIFSVLLREYDFEMAQPPDSYHDDHSKMVVQLAQPAKVRYRRRRQNEHEAERA
jgi:sterol 14-demethylase